MREIKFIGVHHSLSSFGTGETIVRWHTDPVSKGGRGWRHPGYHIVISNGYRTAVDLKVGNYGKHIDGIMEQILSDALIANGCKGMNENSLHVCMIGNFDEAFPTEMQVERLIKLLTGWCRLYSLRPAAILGHHEMQALMGEKHRKSCPGRNVDMDAVRKAVLEMMKIN